jgi:hypothetical protein
MGLEEQVGDKENAEVLRNAMAAADMETIPVMPRRPDKRQDDIALAVHLMTGEELVSLCSDIVGVNNAHRFALDLFEWHIKRLSK